MTAPSPDHPLDQVTAHERVRDRADGRHPRPAHLCRTPARMDLRSGYRTAARLLLDCARFTVDELLIAADAFDELQRELRLDGFEDQAWEAAGLASALRDEAPRRLRRPACGVFAVTPCDLTLLDRAVLLQADAQARGEMLQTGEALRIAHAQTLDRPMHVAGGAA